MKKIAQLSSLIIFSFVFPIHVFSQKTIIDSNTKYAGKLSYWRIFDEKNIKPVEYYSITPTYGVISSPMSENQNTGFGFLFKRYGIDKLGNENPFFIETGVMYFAEKGTPEFSNLINRPLAIVPINIGFTWTMNNLKYGLSTGIVLIPSYTLDQELKSRKMPNYFNINPLIEYEYKHLLLGAYYSFIAKKEPIGYFGIKLGFKFKYIPKVRNLNRVKNKSSL
jgi:hypothetical protein